MSEPRKLTVTVQNMHFFGLDEDDKIAGPDIIVYAGVGNAPENYYLSAHKGERSQILQVYMAGAPLEALAALSLKIHEWFVRKQFEQFYINLFAESMGNIILTVAAPSLHSQHMDEFRTYWNGRQVVWNGAGGLSYSD
jgi:hypothetical protein